MLSRSFSALEIAPRRSLGSFRTSKASKASLPPNHPHRAKSLKQTWLPSTALQHLSVASSSRSQASSSSIRALHRTSTARYAPDGSKSNSVDQEALSRRLRELKDSGHIREAERELKGLTLPLDNWSTALLDVAAAIEFELDNHAVAFEYGCKRWNLAPKDTSVMLALIIAYSGTMIGETDIAKRTLMKKLAFDLEKATGVLPRTMIEVSNGMMSLKQVTHGSLNMLNVLAWVFLVQGDRTSALGFLALSTSLHRDQRDPSLDSLMLLCEQTDDKFEMLLDVSARALNMFPHDIDILEYRLHALKVAKKHELIAEVADSFEKTNIEIPNITRRLLLFKINALFNMGQEDKAKALISENPDIAVLEPTSPMLELLELGRIHLRIHDHRTPVISFIIDAVAPKGELRERDYDLALHFAIDEYKNIPAALELLDHVLKLYPYHIGYKTKRATLAAIVPKTQN